jgi:hypothetical protein
MLVTFRFAPLLTYDGWTVAEGFVAGDQDLFSRVSFPVPPTPLALGTFEVSTFDNLAFTMTPNTRVTFSTVATVDFDLAGEGPPATASATACLGGIGFFCQDFAVNGGRATLSGRLGPRDAARGAQPA